MRDPNSLVPSIGGRPLATYASKQLKDPFLTQEPGETSHNGEFTILYANCTSFSDKIKSHLFSKDCRRAFSGFCFVETKVKPENVNSIKDLFEQHQLHVVCNAGQASSSGDGIHGGEIVGVNSNLNFKGIDPKILKRIATETGAPLRFAAGILRFKGCSILILTLYLRCSVGMDGDNDTRMKQASILTHLTGIPFIFVGDFNMKSEDLLASGWPQYLHASVVNPADCTTTLRHTMGRVIDYVLISDSIIGTLKFAPAVLRIPLYTALRDDHQVAQ